MKNNEKDFKDGFIFCVKMVENFAYGTKATHIETQLLRNFIAKLKNPKWTAYLNTVANRRRTEIERVEAKE